MRPFCTSDRHHFDNPVYSFNSYQKDDGLQPLNNVHKIRVKNNLAKKTNLEKQKLDEEEVSLNNGNATDATFTLS